MTNPQIEMLIITTNEEHPFECIEEKQRDTRRMNPFKYVSWITNATNSF